MVKRLLSLATVLVAFCCVTNAQKYDKCEIASALKYKNVFKTTTATRASSDGVVFSYATGGSVSMVGAGASQYDAAIYVPGKYAGNSIDIIAFYIADKSVVANVKCWIAKTLPANISTGCDYITDVTVTDDMLTTGMPSMVETGGYTIPEGGCYVGYSFDVTNPTAQYGKYAIAFDGGTDTEGGAYLNMQGQGWQDMNGQGLGNLLTLVQMSGDNFLGNSATLESTDFTATAAVNGKANVQLSVKNLGANDIKTLSYTVKDVKTGNVSNELTTTLVTPIMFYEIGKVMFTVEAGNVALGSYDKEITITKVNGNAIEGNESVLTAKGSLLVVSREVTKKIVVEEFTGTGCPNCPRGYAGMAALADKYPNEFIGISPHVSVNYEDPMETVAYDELSMLFYYSGIQLGVPSALLNRTGNYALFDPYFGSSSSTYLGVVNDFEAMRGAAEAEVTVNPQWNEDQTQINVSTDVKFLYNRDDAPYSVAYVLLADGLQGSESNWWQYNGQSYMYGYTASGEEYLDAWLTKGEYDKVYIQDYGNLEGVYVKDMVYDHVALASENLLGASGHKLSGPIVSEQVQNDKATFDVSNGIKGYYLGNELIQDKSKLKVVAMLINTETGEIVNADEKEIAAYDPTGIESVEVGSGENAVEVARYALDGTRLSAPTNGVNIIKMSDGTTRKVVVNK